MPEQTLLERLQAYNNKVDDPARLAQFQTFGSEHYADAEFLNLLKDGLIEVLQNGGGGTAIDQDNIFVYKTIGVQSTYTQNSLATTLNNSNQFTISDKQLMWLFVNVAGTPAAQFDVWIIVSKGKGTYGFNSANPFSGNNLKKVGKTILSINDVVGAGNTQTINFGSITNQTVSAWLNSQTPLVVLQNESNGYRLFKGSIDGTEKAYLFTGAGGTYGASGLQTSMLDFNDYGTVEGSGLDFATLTDLQNAVNEILGDVPEDYNSLEKIAAKVAVLVAIVGNGESDADNIVDTVAELLQVFQNYPEGTDIFTLLSGKVNVSDVVNNLLQTAAGKVLDARQGKVLNDAISALTTTVGTKADLVAGKVPASQLPSYVDDVVEAANLAAFPATGETGKIYVALDSNLIYRWSGSAYVNVSSLDTNRNMTIEFQQLSPNAYPSYDLRVTLSTPLLIRNISAIAEYQLMLPGSSGTTRTAIADINADIAALTTVQAAAGYSIRCKATITAGESFGTAIIKATVL